MNPAPRGDTAEGKKRSPDVARFLSLDWETATLKGDSSYGEADLPFESLARPDAGLLVSEDGAEAARPVMVYVPDAAMALERRQELEAKMFGDDDLALASRIFRFVRLEPDQLSGSQRDDLAPKLPAFILMDGRGQIVSKTTGVKSPSALLKGLSKTYSVQYKGSLARQVQQVDSVLKSIEKLEDKIFYANLNLTELRKRNEAKPTAKLTKSIEEATKELEAQQSELTSLREQRTKLMTPQLTAKFAESKKVGDD